MRNFKLSLLTDDLEKEIAACKTAEELKALFAAKDLFVPDSKLESILKLSERFKELDMDAMEGIVGAGGCECESYEGCVEETCQTMGTP